MIALSRVFAGQAMVGPRMGTMRNLYGNVGTYFWPFISALAAAMIWPVADLAAVTA